MSLKERYVALAEVELRGDRWMATVSLFPLLASLAGLGLIREGNLVAVWPVVGAAIASLFCSGIYFALAFCRLNFVRWIRQRSIESSGLSKRCLKRRWALEAMPIWAMLRTLADLVLFGSIVLFTIYVIDAARLY